MLMKNYYLFLVFKQKWQGAGGGCIPNKNYKGLTVYVSFHDMQAPTAQTKNQNNQNINSF